MNLAQNAIRAYGHSSMGVRSPRSIEYGVFSRISHRLRTATLSRHENYGEFVAALSENRALWTLLAVDVAQPENGLDDDLRGRLFWLAEFVNEETQRVIRKQGDISVLIEINASIMKGLRGRDDES